MVPARSEARRDFRRIQFDRVDASAPYLFLSDYLIDRLPTLYGDPTNDQ